MSDRLIRNSDGWHLLKPELLKKIEKAQALLEDPSDIDRTNLLRGEIGAYRQLIRDIETVGIEHPAQPAGYGQDIT